MYLVAFCEVELVKADIQDNTELQPAAQQPYPGVVHLHSKRKLPQRSSWKNNSTYMTRQFLGHPLRCKEGCTYAYKYSKIDFLDRGLVRGVGERKQGVNEGRGRRGRDRGTNYA